MSVEIESARKEIVDYLYKELIGKRSGELEELEDPPFRRYTAGTLYPQKAVTEAALLDEEEDPTGVIGASNPDNQREDQGDEPVILANQFLPGSIGISFYLSGNPTLEIEAEAARYEEIQPEERRAGGISRSRKKLWRRIPLTTTGEDGKFQIFNPQNGKRNLERYLFGGYARLHIIWRPVDIGWLVTVSLINNRTTESGMPDPEDCLHQVKITCRPSGSGKIPAYPTNRILSTDPEEEILDLLYRRRISYGVGHGCSVDWEESVDGTASRIWSEFLPMWSVPDMRYDLEGDFGEVLSLYYLSQGEEHLQEMVAGLNNFIDAYRSWISNLPRQHADIPADLSDARQKLIDRMNTAAERMYRGIRLLENDRNVLRAFCLANRAMLMQYVHTREDYAGKKRPAGSRSYQPPVLSNFRDRTWRPFQLAFQLLTIPSVAYSEDPDRTLVDLIWFPTGGGKTEAYLAVTAFLIFFRRIMYGTEAGGTSVIMRYTLRLLTTQQFQRASTLICACEIIRRDCPEELGQEEISIGLWVGVSTTPNSYQTAYEMYQRILEQDRPESPFQIDRCPWCGTGILPDSKKRERELYGIDASPERFLLFCPESSCPFHASLPVGVVDDQLYASPPTLLIATVDKFARMTWVDQVNQFFGAGLRRPPELIIQDELHLISGPIGTMVGLYEIAIDALCSWQGHPPKIISSTATIRRAGEQCLGLYGREVELFPPSGLEDRDSYFARYDDSKSGRLYVGFMGQGHTASTSMIRVSAALLQAPIELGFSDDLLDPYWTLVAYHNSLRELGKTRTFAKDDIPARIKVIASDQANRRDLNEDNVDELTSNLNSARLSGMLDRLQRKYNEDESLSFIACTNMFSVGVDVQRLGLMLVNGQPKSTSEYIQSTSRVGRGVPGLVLCLLSPSKPRDRSHYERFIAYHSALYRYVEPTSVTPFSQPARDRALHAVLVSLVRHAIGLNTNNSAANFTTDINNLGRVFNFIRDRVSRVDPREASRTIEQVESLIEQWEAIAKEYTRLVYNSPTPAKRSLLRTAGSSSKEGWDTLHSMRNIDKSSIIKIISE